MEGRLPAAIPDQSGWARSVGGAAPYLTLFARGGTPREAVDGDLARSKFKSFPRAVLKALDTGALEPNEIREAVGSDARSLGDAGKKKGLTTTLPLALEKLQVAGDIRRIPVNGRLDQQRWLYALWDPNPLRHNVLSSQEAFIGLARRYFRWIGPATLAEFQWFSGLGDKAAKAVVDPLGLETLDGGRLMFAEDLDRLQSFKVPKHAHYSLVSSLDAIALLRRDLKTLTNGNLVLRAPLLTDLPHHAIFDRGNLVGLWDYDPSTESIAWESFIPENPELKNAVNRTEEFIRLELGDARAFSLDTPKSRTSRMAGLR